MKKSILWLIGCLFSFTFLTASCSESSEEVDPYANWEERNQHYIDSIASVARANLGNEVGQWKVFISYKLDGVSQGQGGDLGQGGLGPGGNLGQPDLNKVENYIYCKILKKGSGTKHPNLTDKVETHYRGKLINGYQFDSSYSGETLEEDFSTPATFPVGQVIVGWSTALLKMVEGDYWEVYLPYQLAYGTSGTTGIPGNSTLIFDIQLVDILPLTGIEGKSVAAPVELEAK